MLKIKIIEPNKLELKISGKFQLADFDQLEETINKMTKTQNNIKILINSSEFTGWNNMATMRKHLNFIQTHHKKIDKLAVIRGPWWQTIILNFAKIILHPKVKSFALSQAEEANIWFNE